MIRKESNAQVIYFHVHIFHDDDNFNFKSGCIRLHSTSGINLTRFFYITHTLIDTVCMISL